MEKTTIKECGRFFKFQCPREWDALTPTDRPYKRYCETCRKHVFLCETHFQITQHHGQCIAVPGALMAEILSNEEADKDMKPTTSYAMGEYD